MSLFYFMWWSFVLFPFVFFFLFHFARGPSLFDSKLRGFFGGISGEKGTVPRFFSPGAWSFFSFPRRRNSKALFWYDLPIQAFFAAPFFYFPPAFAFVIGCNEGFRFLPLGTKERGSCGHLSPLVFQSCLYLRESVLVGLELVEEATPLSFRQVSGNAVDFFLFRYFFDDVREGFSLL